MAEVLGFGKKREVKERGYQRYVSSQIELSAEQRKPSSPALPQAFSDSFFFWAEA